MSVHSSISLFAKTLCLWNFKSKTKATGDIKKWNSSYEYYWKWYRWVPQSRGESGRSVDGKSHFPHRTVPFHLDCFIRGISNHLHMKTSTKPQQKFPKWIPPPMWHPYKVFTEIDRSITTSEPETRPELELEKTTLERSGKFIAPLIIEDQADRSLSGKNLDQNVV